MRALRLAANIGWTGNPVGAHSLANSNCVSHLGRTRMAAAPSVLRFGTGGAGHAADHSRSSSSYRSERTGKTSSEPLRVSPTTASSATTSSAPSWLHVATPRPSCATCNRVGCSVDPPRRRAAARNAHAPSVPLRKSGAMPVRRVVSHQHSPIRSGRRRPSTITPTRPRRCVGDSPNEPPFQSNRGSAAAALIPSTR